MARKQKHSTIDPTIVDTIIDREFSEVMDDKYTTYSLSVLEDRALPDARDGLKPSQRRVLVTMDDLSLRPGGKTKKCAKITGQTSGDYHPHGDQVIYPTLARMAQPWVMRYPLVTGQGNFGSIDPEDKPAAQRYTEAKLSPAGDGMLSELSKQVVPYVPNYNDEGEEPTVLPSKLPNLIVNGCSGIAVAWATNMAPHNLREVAQAIKAYIAKPTLTVDELIQIMPGPDFPTGGILLGQEGVKQYYSTGRGTVEVEGVYTIEQNAKGVQYIVINQLPYGASPSKFGRQLKELIEAKKIDGITDYKNLSASKGGELQINLRIEVAKSASAQVIVNKLLKGTCLRETFSVNTTVLLDGKRVVENVSMLQLIGAFVEHRRTVLFNKFTAEKEKHEKRLHILEGLLGITDKLDAVIKLIRASESREEAARQLVEKAFVKSAEQAEAVLKLTLGTLTRIDTQALLDEQKKLTERVAWLTEVLGDDKKLRKLIAQEQEELAKQIGDDRRTVVGQAAEDINYADLIPVEQVVISITNDGYIKRQPVTQFPIQKRGGKGMRGMAKRENEEAGTLFIASTHDILLFFTSDGQMFRRFGYEIPQATRTAKGTHLAQLLQLKGDQQVAGTISVSTLDQDTNLLFVTAGGVIKRSKLREYDTKFKNIGVEAIALDEGDKLINVEMTDGKRDVFLVTKKGKAIRYPESTVRLTGRRTRGVLALNLQKGDAIAQMITLDAQANPDILVITEYGYGQRTPSQLYRCLTGRYAIGVNAIDRVKEDRNGLIIGAAAVTDDDSLFILTDKGLMTHYLVQDFRPKKSRQTQGVRAVTLNDGDKVASFIKIENGRIYAEQAEEAEESELASV